MDKVNKYPSFKSIYLYYQCMRNPTDFKLSTSIIFCASVFFLPKLFFVENPLRTFPFHILCIQNMHCFYHYYTTLVSVFQVTCVSRCRNVKAFWVLLQQGTKETAAVTDGAFNARRSFAPTSSRIATVPAYQVTNSYQLSLLQVRCPSGRPTDSTMHQMLSQLLLNHLLDQ